MTLFYY